MKIANYLRLSWTLVILSFLAAAMAWWHWHWLWQPYLLIVTGLVATQYAATYSSSVLEDHNLRLQLHPEYSDDLTKNIGDRARDQSTNAGRALSGYLRQVTATWGLVFLTIGYCVVLLVRGISSHSNIAVVYIAGFTLAALLGLILDMISHGRLSRASIKPYYEWHSTIPPPVRLTAYRVVFLVIYSAVVITAFRPDLQQDQSGLLRVEQRLSEVEDTLTNRFDKLDRSMEELKAKSPKN